MCRKIRIWRVSKTMISLLAIPFCVHMGMQSDKHIDNNVVDCQKDFDTFNDVGICTETHAAQTSSNNTVQENIEVSECVTECSTNYTNLAFTEPDIDWTKLSNNLPTLYDYNTITIDKDLQAYIYDISKKYDVPYELTLAVCYVESEFTANINNAGTNSDGTTDWGIMGLNDLYLEGNCDIYNNGIMIDPYNPYENIYIGVQILADNLEYFDGNIYDAANAYNLGAYGWQNMKNNGQTWYYGDKVLEYIDTLENTLM